MLINEFKFLTELSIKGKVLLMKNKGYAEAIYESNIPFRPGVYFYFHYTLGISVSLNLNPIMSALYDW